MQDIDVLYLYEFVARELDVACAVKSIAARRYGLKIHIDQHPFGELLSDLTRFRPHIVTLPHVASSNIPYVLEWPDAIYLNLMWEQILYKGNVRAKMPRGEFALRYMMHNAWSDLSASLLQEMGVPSEHIAVNGNPAYTLYTEPYRRLYNRRDELARQYRLDSDKAWIFFPENYNWAFYDDVQLNNFIIGGQTANEVYAMRDFCRVSFTDAIKWCNIVAKTGCVELIVRPRPGTPLADFRSAVQQASGHIPDHLHIIKNESVREWIIARHVVISSYSTSLIEGAVAGTPTFILEPHPIPEFISMDWHDLTPHIKTQAEFEAICQSAGAATADPRLGDWARATMMPNGDAIRDLADWFSQLSCGQVMRSSHSPRESLSLSPEFHLPPLLLFEYHKMYRAYQRFRRKMRPMPVRPNAIYEKELVGQAEIERRVKQWDQLLSDYQGGHDR